MIIKLNKSRILNLIIFLLYFGLTFLVMIKHESWRDEAQIWLEVRDMPVQDVIKSLGANGGGGFWQFLIFPLAKNNFPYYSMKIINYSAFCFAVLIFIFYSPFNLLFKIAVLFSYHFLYEYPSFSRSYCSSVFLIFFISFLYKERFRKPVLFFLSVFILSNTNIFGFMFGISVLLIYILEFIMKKNKTINFKKIFIAIFIGFSGLIIAFLQTNQGRGSQVGGELLYMIQLETVIIDFFSSIYSNISSVFFCNNPISGFFAITAFVLVFILVKKNMYKLFIFIIECQLLLFWFLLERNDIYQLGYVLVFAISVLWISYQNNLRYVIMQVLIIIILFMQIPDAFSAYINDVRFVFSDSKNVAELLVKKKLEKKILIGCSDNPNQLSNLTSILPYMPEVKLYDIFMDEYMTYLKENVHKKSFRMSLEEIVKKIRSNFNLKDAVIICDVLVDQKNAGYLGLKKIYESNPGVIDADERYAVYIFDF
ncbi:MAG TPA: hypothetical protein PLQ81_06840 [bacterium]|nr:hypothetical protein [bacterium]